MHALPCPKAPTDLGLWAYVGSLNVSWEPMVDFGFDIWAFITLHLENRHHHHFDIQTSLCLPCATRIDSAICIGLDMLRSEIRACGSQSVHVLRAAVVSLEVLGCCTPPVAIEIPTKMMRSPFCSTILLSIYWFPCWSHRIMLCLDSVCG